MTQHFPALLIIIPLLSALIVSAMGWIDRRWCFPLAVASLAGALAVSVGLCAQVMAAGPIVYKMAGWRPPIGIVYVIDYLNAPVLVVILAVALLNLISAKTWIERDFAEKLSAYLALYLMFLSGMVGIVATGDAFNLYVLLEIGSLTGYALIGLGKERAPLSSLNYLFMGTIGASFYLLGIGYIYIATGTLNMADIARLMPKLAGSGTLFLALVICMAGLFVKMALFPLHGWLPNAYSNAPSASAGLIAPLTTKVMIYAMVRVGLTVFTPEFTFSRALLSEAIVWLAVAAIVTGSLLALMQRRLSRMLTYIIVAEVGYMVGGFWLGNKAGVTGATLHIINDAAMTLTLFMAVSAIVWKLGSDRFEDLQGLFGKMPFTMTGFVLAALAVIGIPPTCGFFSKWYLISGGIDAGQWGFVAALLFSSLVNAVLFFRIFEIAFFEPFAEGHGHHDHGPVMSEAPVTMVVPLILAALSLIALGLYTGDIVTKLIQLAIPAGIA
ncbi:monovalent cation/H+ antiporter subunit D family protein [Desulfoluna spongiiphila]|uniref:monovalent cation/H+ antiporter subunit D family protein n=1 Tax=Desulfoluna spongiiphila TaxID=419481 RepID=UPI00125564CB|nr:monovalent cation/H+ antiporter subunit D family protein [Desulfoluna spongiiphila]VVS93340.1 nadh:quinone oxidoreductase/mrp antiporter membrane subunit [Desulfoluna spongiiphila]